MIRPSEDHVSSCLYLLIAIATLLPSKVIGRCFFFFDSRMSTSGNFSSPGWPDPYGAGLRCTYVFQGEMFQAVRVVFQSFHLEEPYKAGCLADYLDVTTVDVAGVREFVGRYCGREVKSPILTLHPRLEFYLDTNLALNAQGFNGSYSFLHEESIYPSSTTMDRGEKSVVCGGLLQGRGGRLVSPGYPNAFPGGLSCRWLLRARPHHHIYLRIQELQLQGSIANCRRAELSIHDGYRASDTPSLKTFCGDLDYYRNQAEKVVLSQRNRLLVSFRTSEPSDNTTSMAGFLLLWTEVALTTKDNCSASGGFWCEQSVYCVGVIQGSGCISTAHFCIDPGLVCDGQPNCSTGDHTDEIECGDVVMMVTGVAAGTCAALLAVAGAAVVWLRCSGRRRQHHVGSSPAMNSLGASQPLVASPSTSSFPSNLTNNVSRSERRSADISWVEVPVPTPPPPPFLSPPFRSKGSPSNPSHSPPLPIHAPLIRSHSSPLPPPNSPVVPSQPPSPAPPPTPSKSPTVLPKIDAPPLLTSSSSSPPYPVPPPPSPLPFQRSPVPTLPGSPSSGRCSSSRASSASPMPHQQNPSPQRLSPSPQEPPARRRSPLQEVLLDSPPSMERPSPESPSSEWPILSPPPTPPPPPISDPMQSAWLAAIKVPRKSEALDAQQGNNCTSSSSASWESARGDRNPRGDVHDETHNSASDAGSSKTSGVQSGSTSLDSTKSRRSSGGRMAREHTPECRRRHSLHRHNQNHNHCQGDGHFSHGSAGCILHLQNNHSSAARPYGLVRSRSLPKHRTRVQPSSYAPYDISRHPWLHTPDTKRRKSCLGGWGDDDDDEGNSDSRDKEESPEGTMCFPCVSGKSRALSKSSVDTMRRRDFSNPSEGKRGGVGHYHGAHPCPHRAHHHMRHHSHCCHRSHHHGHMCSSFELKS